MPSRLVPLLSVAAAVVLGCAGAGTQAGPDDPPSDLRRAELAALMKLRLNPPFSRISMVLFHADGAGVEEISAAVTALETTVGELRRFADPPVGSDQAQLVFAEFAAHLAADVARLRTALQEGRAEEAPRIFDRVRRTCDNCHRFFRIPPTSER